MKSCLCIRHSPLRNYLLGAVPVLAMLLLGAAGWRPQSGEEPQKVVLAELFTGSECPPCVASDLAFEELLNNYPSTQLAVLEYHLHIPGPDPMTGPSSVERAQYYEVRSTPSVFIDGREVGGGGGPEEYARAKFNTYSSAVNRGLRRTPVVEVVLHAERTGQKVKIAVTVRPAGNLRRYNDMHLRIVLAEKILFYLGGNNIQGHQMVVRELIEGNEGLALDLSEKEFSTDVEVDIGEIEAELLTYLNDSEERFIARYGRYGWNGFSYKMNKIAPADLIVVAFVQDDRRSQVLQAQLVELN